MIKLKHNNEEVKRLIVDHGLVDIDVDLLDDIEIDLYKIEHNDKFAGICGLQKIHNMRSPHVHLKRDFQGEGIGKEVINILGDIAQKEKSKTMIGFTPIDRKIAIKMMDSCGYDFVEIRDGLSISIKELNYGT